MHLKNLGLRHARTPRHLQPRQPRSQQIHHQTHPNRIQPTTSHNNLQNPKCCNNPLNLGANYSGEVSAVLLMPLRKPVKSPQYVRKTALVANKPARNRSFEAFWAEFRHIEILWPGICVSFFSWVTIFPPVP